MVNTLFQIKPFLWRHFRFSSLVRLLRQVKREKMNRFVLLFDVVRWMKKNKRRAVKGFVKSPYSKWTIHIICLDFRVVEIDAQRRQVSIRRPMTDGSAGRGGGDDSHNFYFDAVYDWK